MADQQGLPSNEHSQTPTATPSPAPDTSRPVSQDVAVVKPLSVEATSSAGTQPNAAIPPIPDRLPAEKPVVVEKTSASGTPTNVAIPLPDTLPVEQLVTPVLSIPGVVFDEALADKRTTQEASPLPHTTHLVINELDDDWDANNPRWGTASVSQRTELILRIREDHTEFRFDAGTLEKIVLGRYDPDSGTSPEVNLEAHGGVEQGVSRRHAAIVRQNGMLHIMDMGSYNGTYLNSQKLVPQQARILRNGDDIRLGHLTLEVKFIHTVRHR